MKRFLTVLLAAMLLVALLTVSVSAVSLADQTPGQAAKAMTFPTDGSNHVAVCPVCGKQVTWYPLTAATVSAGKTLTKNYHYYLTEDVDTTYTAGPLISAASSTGNRCCLHLNGKKLINRGNVALQGAVSRFNIMGDGIVQGAKTGAEEGATIQINPGMDYGTIALYGGTYSKVNPGTTANVAAARGNGGKIELHDGATIQAGTAGSAVYLNGEMAYVSAVFRMYGGTLDASATSELAVDMEEDVTKKANKVEFHMAGGTLISGTAGAVTVRDTTAVYMTGGTIQNGHITIEANGKMEMSGGTITGGSATNGGNIYIAPDAKLTMTGGTIQNGSATSGGNVYVDKNAVFTMSGGKLLSGSAKNGGNVYVGYTGSTIEETAPRFTMTGGSLEKGTATGEGGNLYAVGINTNNAQVYLKNATITGGTAASNGGNIVLNRSNMTMEEGAEILNGTSTGARAGNIRLYIGKLIMKGGSIAGGSAKTGATDNIWAYGVSAKYPGSVYMLGGVIAPSTDRHNAGISLAAYGRLYLANDATFTNVDPQCAAVAVGSSGGNYGKLFICDGWSGFADAYVLDKGYAAGAEVSDSYIQIVKLKDDLTTTVGGSFTGTLVQLYQGSGQFIPGAASGKLTVANSVLVAQDGKLTATTDPVTDWAAGSYAYLKLNADLTIEDLGGKELTVDLNGYDLAVGGSGNVKAFDSQNDNYSAVLCGKITATGDVTVEKETFAPNGNRYVAITDSGKITMHRLDMYMTAVTIRTSAAGLYYKATYKCDKVLEAKVAEYGVVLSVNNMPGADFASDEEKKDNNLYTVATTGFKSGMTVTSGSVFGIMKEDRKAASNDIYGQIRIYANPYVKLNADSVFVGDTKNPGKTAASEGFDGIAYSLQDAMNTVDHIFYDYNLTDRNQFSSFYETWKEKGMDWSFDNIGDRYAVDNSDLKFSSGNQAYCPVCQKTVTWTAMTQAAYGTSRLTMSAGGHYYLAEDITYTGADAAAIRGPSGTTPACLHLNGHDLVATNEGAIIGYTGIMNVLGNGTVMGNATAETTGAAVNINTSGANGKVNLYGGIYTLPQANETAPAVGVANNGGEINIYEGVTVRGAGGYSVYMGEANLRSAKLGIYGAKIEGVVNCAEPSDSKARSCTLEIGGNAEIDEVKTRSMYIQDRLSGAPKIGLMSMVANVAMELDGLSEGTQITVNSRGTLTAASDRIEEYKKYFTTFTDTHSLKVVDNALQYEIDFEPYMTPFIRDVSAEAIADGKIHYYFMSTEGFVTSPTAADNIYKWGDSCLIVFPNGETMLVDTGYSMQQPWLIGNLKRMGIGSEENPLDYLLITHPHSDHQGAFYSASAFFDEIKVTQVYHNKLRIDSASTDEYVENVCAARNLPLMDLKQGTELDFGDVHMEVLWPAPAMATTNIGTGKINDNSMVFRLDYGEHSALFTGDIYTLAEGQILDTVDNAKLDVDFLKIPHHGWNTSSSAEFVKAVSAQLGVATSFLEMEEQIRRNYVSAKTEVLLDVYNGYIHVSADAEGNMDYETSR